MIKFVIVKNIFENEMIPRVSRAEKEKNITNIK
jgi:hypothetical protein